MVNAEGTDIYLVDYGIAAFLADHDPNEATFYLFIDYQMFLKVAEEIYFGNDEVSPTIKDAEGQFFALGAQIAPEFQDSIPYEHYLEFQKVDTDED